ncbi:MAG: type II toxin-antitoxin system HigB family toxin [Chloroflexota bacterium]|nr:type II toxin-antitoxin system HigB family toxin [Chloroflexota bacterium]MDE2919627.1 type II toxin-antitoxin system HigB family toxin [Chloroflexota bacterium]
MRIIAREPLDDFAKRHADARGPLLAWFREVEKEDWDSPSKVRDRYPRASIVGEDRVVFRIKGNAYRLVARVNYPYRVVVIRFIGTHAEYDRIDAREV